MTKICPEKISYNSGNGNPEQNFLYFLKKSFSHISGKWNPEKTSHISRSNYESSKNETTYS